MGFDPNKSGSDWEQRLHEAGARIEEDLQRLLKYVNDEVVPEVRKNGSSALRAAAEQMQRLAEKMDDQRRTAGDPGPTKDGPKQ